MDQSTLNSRPAVSLYIKDPSLASYLVQELLVNFCQPSLYVSERDFETWRQRLSYLLQNKNFRLDVNYNVIDNKDMYSIFSLDYFDSKNIDLINKTIENIKSRGVRVLLLIPQDTGVYEKEAFSFLVKEFEDYDNFKSITYAEAFGPKMLLASNGFSGLIKNAFLNRKLAVKDEKFMLSYTPTLAKAVVKALFSFGAKNGPMYLTSEVSSQEVVVLFKSFFKDVEVKELYKKAAVPKIAEKRYMINSNFRQDLGNTLVWFSKNPLESRPSPKKPLKIKFRKIPSFSVEFNKKPIVTFVTTVILFFIVVPFLVFGAGIGVFASGVYLLNSGKNELAAKTFGVSVEVLDVSQRLFFILGSAPILSSFYQSSHDASKFSYQASQVALEASELSTKSKAIVGNIVTKKPYDVEKTFSEVKLNLDSIYKNTSFLESEIGSLGVYSKPIQAFLQKHNLAEIRGSLLFMKELSEDLPELLGSKKEAKYMILFQNNAELRPTGGFIGSFGLVGFEKGILKELEIFDVYDADGQLKGYVEPPAPIVTHLGEASWYMRDANWDPDFPTSAAKIEWFLGKELGKSVDGVIAVDLYVLQSILESVGEVYVPDYSLSINKDNFYEITQSHAEDDFFPGSTKKRNFLTALSRALILRLTDSEGLDYTTLFKNFYQNLTQRNIQVSLNFQKPRRILSDVGFDGRVEVPVCPLSNCFPDYLGLVEANLGVNKVNPHITRSMNLQVNIDKGLIKRELDVTYKNTSDINKNLSYKNYLRLLVTKESQVVGVVVDGVRTPFEIEEVKGHKEVGLIMEVPAKQDQTVKFIWQEKVQEVGLSAYQLNWRKQAGTGADPVSVKVSSSGISNYSEKEGSLTQEGAYVYNTLLAHDIHSRIYFKDSSKP